MFKCVVIICTFNAPDGQLARVLAALRDQTLPTSQWELLVVDNLSTPPLAPRLDLSWHPNASCVREATPGHLAARIRGARETTAPLLIFVDDDNLLSPAYLTTALEISHAHPAVAVWCGQCHPEFESPPPAWTRPHWSMLAIWEFAQEEITPAYGTCAPLPHGAGMCVRRPLMNHFIQAASHCPIRPHLGRTGTNLMSCDDNDIALVAFRMGWATARFPTLKLTHLIPPARLTRSYLLRLTEAMAASREVLFEIHSDLRPPRPSLLRRYARQVRHFLRFPGWERDRHLAMLRGEKLGLSLIHSIRHFVSPSPASPAAATTPQPGTSYEWPKKRDSHASPP